MKNTPAGVARACTTCWKSNLDGAGKPPTAHAEDRTYTDGFTSCGHGIAPRGTAALEGALGARLLTTFREGGGGTHYLAWPSSYDHRPSYACNYGTEHARAIILM